MRERKIRDIWVTDVHDIYLLNQEFNPNLQAYSEQQVKAKIEVITTKTNDKILVCEQDNEVIGYIHGSPYELLFADSLLNILGFIVKEKARNQGIGSLLIESLEQWGMNNGYSGIKLLSHPSRIPAHQFYEHRGYVFTKDQKNFIKTFQ